MDFRNLSANYSRIRKLKYVWLLLFLIYEVFSCPKVCECKWKGGKQWVTCSRAKFIDIPQGLDSSTQALNLERNNLQILFRDAFVDRGLVNLQKIFLPHCKLRRLEKGSFRKLANLVELDLSFNFLKQIPTEALSDVPGLRGLSLRSNNLTHVPPNAFQSTPDLIHLDLGRNNIRAVEEKAFRFLSKLEIMNLAGNKLVSIAVSIFKPLVSLHGLDLHANPWNCNCFLRPLRHWMLERNIAATVPPTCNYPKRLQSSQWESLSLDEFVCVPHVTAIAPRVLASHGDNVSLACRVDTDANAQVTWLIGNKAVAKGESSAAPRYKVLELVVPNVGTLSRVSNLTIAGADLHDQGIYRCVVENKAGRVETNLTLKVSEVISENSLVAMDQVFVAGALLGGLAFVAFAIFISCAAFYRRKKSHALQIAKLNLEMLETSLNSSDISNTKMASPRPGYAEYQVVPTSDTDISLSECQNKVKSSDKSGNDMSVRDNLNTEIPVIKTKEGSTHLEPLEPTNSHSFRTSEEPLLQNLALQCKNHALKRHSFREQSNIFGKATDGQFPDLLTSQRPDVRFNSLPRSRSPKIQEDQASIGPQMETPSLPTTPLQSHILQFPWRKMLRVDSDEEMSMSRHWPYEPYSSLHPYDGEYKFHANQLQHFLQEYKILQEQLYRMKETAVEAPEVEPGKSVTSRSFVKDAEKHLETFLSFDSSAKDFNGNGGVASGNSVRFLSILNSSNSPSRSSVTFTNDPFIVTPSFNYNS